MQLRPVTTSCVTQPLRQGVNWMEEAKAGKKTADFRSEFHTVKESPTDRQALMKQSVQSCHQRLQSHMKLCWLLIAVISHWRWMLNSCSSHVSCWTINENKFSSLWSVLTKYITSKSGLQDFETLVPYVCFLFYAISYSSTPLLHQTLPVSFPNTLYSMKNMLSNLYSSLM